MPDYDYKFGQLKFDRSIRPISDRFKESRDASSSDSFEGEGMHMKRTRK